MKALKHYTVSRVSLQSLSHIKRYLKFGVWLQTKREKVFLFKNKDQDKTNNTELTKLRFFVSMSSSVEKAKGGEPYFVGQTFCGHKETLRRDSVSKATNYVCLLLSSLHTNREDNEMTYIGINPDLFTRLVVTVAWHQSLYLITTTQQ